MRQLTAQATMQIAAKLAEIKSKNAMLRHLRDGVEREAADAEEAAAGIRDRYGDLQQQHQDVAEERVRQLCTHIFELKPGQSTEVKSRHDGEVSRYWRPFRKHSEAAQRVRHGLLAEARGAMDAAIEAFVAHREQFRGEVDALSVAASCSQCGRPYGATSSEICEACGSPLRAVSDVVSGPMEVYIPFWYVEALDEGGKRVSFMVPPCEVARRGDGHEVTFELRPVLSDERVQTGLERQIRGRVRDTTAHNELTGDRARLLRTQVANLGNQGLLSKQLADEIVGVLDDQGKG
jgi:hypothetical protein